MVATEVKPAIQVGRPRSDASREAIFRAALTVLETRTLRELTIEEIARQAGVGKATIYKWWPGKAFVALEAFLNHFQHEVRDSDTGSAQKDLLQQLTETMKFYAGPMGRVYRDFVAECQHDPVFAEVYRKTFLVPRRDSIRVIWERGIQRGEIDPIFGYDLVIDMVFAPLVYRLLIGHAPFTGAEAKRLIEGVFRGIRPPTN